MRLTRVNPHRDCQCLCQKCGQWKPCSNSFADLDGEPFVAYYCLACIQNMPSLSLVLEPSPFKPDLEER